MAQTIELKVPDIGDFEAVEVIEVLIAPGDTVEPEQSLITLESDKATMEVPALQGGVIKAVKVKVGDRVSAGSLVALLEPAPTGAAASPRSEESPRAVAPAEDAKPVPAGVKTPPPEPERLPPASLPGEGAPAFEAPAQVDCDVVVIGAGPGGYTAAFRAADLGLKTILIERHASLGGVCLNVGCIPSKALLHAAKVLDEVDAFAAHGIEFGKPRIDLAKLGAWKASVVDKLTGGLAALAKQRKVEVVQGLARFASPHELTIEQADGGRRTLRFRNCIIAAGSRPAIPPGFDMSHPRLMDSTDALRLEEVPERLLVVGGGIIGLEMATVYAALGSRVTIVEMLDRLMNGADADLVRPLRKRIDARYEAIYLSTRVAALEPDATGVTVRFEGQAAPAEARFDRVLVAVGRTSNADRLNLEAAGVQADARGLIAVDEYQRTNVPHIYAIGDIVGQPMLAHKASYEGKIAAQNCAGQRSAFDARVIPAVAYTDPEVAWVGLTEEAAREQGVAVDKGVFPWAANGRSLSLGRDEGLTKLLFDKDSGRLLGGGIVGPNAGDLIAEVALAIEMGAEAEDIGLTIHPHPTLSETVLMAAEAVAGTLTDLYLPKKK